MLGRERFDRELLDALSVCGDLIPVGSVYRFLAEHRRRVFGDGLFEDLYGGRGRPSIPASVVATVMVLQALEGLSDREAIQRLRCDIRWKAAAGLALTDQGFHPTVLTLWRARLRNSSRPQRVFDAVRTVVTETGALTGRDRRVLDSTVLDDAVVTQDTVTMITAQIRRCRRLIAQARETRVVAHDYEQAGKPVCDWSDSDSRSELINGLVGDGLAVLKAMDGVDLDTEQADAVGLLAVVVGQDVEPDPDREGKWRIARKVAPDRTISVVDPQARHTRKTSSQKRDGYKAHIAAEPTTGIITACDITAANVADGGVGVELLADETPGLEIIADSAYGSGENRAQLEKTGHRTTVKLLPQHRNHRLGNDQFTRDDFTIDHQNKQVTCPAGNTTTISAKGRVKFGAACAACPLRSRCTTSPKGRSLLIHPHDQLLIKARTQWANPKTKTRYNRHRPSVERIIAHIVANGTRKLKYRGIQPNRQQLHTRAAAINLRRLINLGLHHTPTGWAIHPT